MAMLEKTINSILTFDKNNYETIIKKIEESRCYDGYINRRKKFKDINKRYDRYLSNKQLIYIKYIIDESKRTEKYVKNADGSEIDYDNLDKLYKKYYQNKKNSGIDDYVYFDKANRDITIKIDVNIEKENFLSIETGIEETLIKLKEYDLSVLSETYLSTLGEIDIGYLENDFLDRNYITFTLPSFLGKRNGDYVDNLVILSIYDCGLINLKVILLENKDNFFEDEDDRLMDGSFDFVEVIKPKIKYKSEDFFEKINLAKGSRINDVIDYYIKTLDMVLGNSIIHRERKYEQVEFSFLDYSEKIDYKILNLMLSNGTYEYISGINDDDLQHRMFKSKIMDRKNFKAYSNEISLIQYYPGIMFDAKIREQTKEKDVSIYRKSVLLNSSISNSRIYEIATIKKYYYCNEYEKLKQNRETIVLNDLKNVEKQIKEFEFRYDTHNIFLDKTTFVEVYEKIYENIVVPDYKKLLYKEIKILLDQKKNDSEESKKTYKTKREGTKDFINIISGIFTILVGLRFIPGMLENISKGIKVEFIQYKNIAIFIDEHNFKITLCLILIIIIIIVISFKKAKKIIKK